MSCPATLSCLCLKITEWLVSYDTVPYTMTEEEAVARLAWKEVVVLVEPGAY